MTRRHFSSQQLAHAANRAQIRLGIWRALFSDGIDPADFAATRIVAMREIDGQVIRDMHGAESIYHVELADGSEHDVAVRGEREASGCITCGDLCPATVRVLILLAIRSRKD